MFSLPLSLSPSLYLSIYYIYIMYGLLYIIEMTKFFHTESNRSSRVAMRLYWVSVSAASSATDVYNMRYMTFVVDQNDHVGARSDEL